MCLPDLHSAIGANCREKVPIRRPGELKHLLLGPHGDEILPVISPYSDDSLGISRSYIADDGIPPVRVGTSRKAFLAGQRAAATTLAG